MRLASTELRNWLIALAVTLIVPFAASATDPVERLREALMIEVPTKFDLGGKLVPDRALAAKRNKMIEAVLPELKTIAQLRAAYFLKHWSYHIKTDKQDPLLDLDRYRVQVGEQLVKTIRATAQEPSAIKQQALAILIAGIANSEQSVDRDRDKFARALADVVLSLAKQKDLGVRQAALSALGKITPSPADAFPVLASALQKDEVGPRRLAAYALSDLVKNQRHLINLAERIDTIEKTITTATIGLRDTDELVRGYSVQALQEAGRIVADNYTSGQELTGEERKAIQPHALKILQAFQASNSGLVQTLFDKESRVRLATLYALDQLANMRVKIIHSLQEINPDKRETTAETLKAFGAPDPLGTIVERELRTVVKLLNEEDARLRRGTMEFLEQLDDQAAPVADVVTSALRDPDRMVRSSAARTMRHLPVSKINAEAIRVLGTILIDSDPDVSKAAADAIEAIGPAAHDTVDWLAFVIGNGDTDSRNWDAENRIAAMKALVSIGGTAAPRAVPKLVVALADGDVRVRREAAATLGRVGPSADKTIADQTILALHKAMGDDDQDVSLHASEAILTLAPTKKGL